jgi:ribosomal protein S18 acetylase RimI-like enzyme
LWRGLVLTRVGHDPRTCEPATNRKEWFELLAERFDLRFETSTRESRDRLLDQRVDRPQPMAGRSMIRSVWRLVLSAAMEVRACGPRDLADLRRALPLTGPYGHEHRLLGQTEGRWLYLLVLAAEPIGSCVVHWRGPVHDSVRSELPNCLEITNMYVAEHARRRGVGRTLLAQAELAAVQRGHAAIGVGVDIENPEARRLYESTGYATSGLRYRVEYDYVDENRQKQHAVETDEFLVKALGTGEGRDQV